MATRGRRGPLDPKSGFREAAQDTSGNIHPSILKAARRSGQLNISGRSLTTVPDSVWRLNIDVPEEARNVSLDNTEDRWWEQAELTKLILASNWLTCLSEDLSNFPALTVLDVHDNRLQSLPNALGKLENLQRLDISRNKLCELPACVTEVITLKSLHVEHNQITQIDDNLGQLYNLEDLDISNNQLVTLPRGVGHLTRVSKFNVSNNKIQRLPPETGCMDGLRYFDVTHNEIESLSEDFGRLLHLEQLYVRHNRLKDIPYLKDCCKLKELHLGNNRIQQITADHLECLKSVMVLDLRDNKLAVLPDEIILLEGLERLDLSNNDLLGLPYSLGTIVSLKSVVLDGNPMKSIRRDIILRGTTELKKYLVSRMEEPAPTPVKSKGIESSQGQSGVIGGSGDGLKAHDIHQSKTLDYSGHKSSEVPLDIWEVAEKAGVTKVLLGKNNFSQLPENLMVLQDTLKILDLGFNKITLLHPDIGLFMSLVSLDLRNNALTDLPKDMESLDLLREIFLSHNRLVVLPSVLYDLKKLEIIFADNNKIEQIDAKGLCSLHMLGTLDLQNNNIAQVPPELGKCTQLKSLLLSGNAFRNPRPAILAKGTPALLEYLRTRIVS